MSLREKIKFASINEARNLLSQNDTYTDNLGRFDIESRMKQSGATLEELLDFAANQALDWTLDEKEKIEAIINSLDTVIREQKLLLPFPDTIYFVKTTGMEEDGAAGYTRENYVVLVEKYLHNGLNKRIIHELFHILTRNDAAFKEKLYPLIGFEMMQAIPFPEAMKDLQFSNPDAPFIDSYIRLEHKGVPVDCAMILYASDHYQRGRFVDYLKVGFLKLDNKKTVLENGKPVIYSVEEISGFFEQVGTNTPYAIHPEEILADNFYFVIAGKTDLPSQWLVDKMKIQMTK
jgi:hypothetical protein